MQSHEDENAPSTPPKAAPEADERAQVPPESPVAASRDGTAPPDISDGGGAAGTAAAQEGSRAFEFVESVVMVARRLHWKEEGTEGKPK